MPAFQTRELTHHHTLVERSRSFLKGRGIDTEHLGPVEILDRSAAIDGAGDLKAEVTRWVKSGFGKGDNSLEGIYTLQPASSFLEEQLAMLDCHPRPGRVARGQAAPTAAFGVVGACYRAARFGLAFEIAEEDAIDTPIDALRIAIEESVASLRSMVTDLLWAVLLANEPAADGVAIFHANRGNLGQAVLGTAGLDAAIGAIGSQVGRDANNAPVHLNLRPSVLFVPPAKFGAAARLAHAMEVNGAGPSVRAESRLDSTGVLDPKDGSTLLTANGSNWMLAASAAQSPSLVLATLDGMNSPTVRTYALRQGQWGWGFSINFDCAAFALDGKGLYWSSGTV